MDEIKLIRLKEYSDSDGKLTAINDISELPFIPKRIFIIHDLNSSSIRGEHASSSSEFVIVLLKGRACIELFFSNEKKEIVLDKSSQALFIPVMTWMKLYDFTDDSIVMVLASKEYNKDDYIEDFDEYLREVKARFNGSN